MLDLQVRRPLVDQRLADANGYVEVEGIDDVEDVALVDELVIGHPQFDDLARYLRRDVGDLHAHAAVARPGRGDVVLPCDQRDQDGDQGDGERRKAFAGRENNASDGVAPAPWMAPPNGG